MTYIWQHPNWPNFSYSDNAIPDQRLYRYAQALGRLSAKLQNVPQDQRLDASIDLMVSEAIKTSAIEGEKLSPDTSVPTLKIQSRISHCIL